MKLLQYLRDKHVKIIILYYHLLIEHIIEALTIFAVFSILYFGDA